MKKATSLYRGGSDYTLPLEQSEYFVFRLLYMQKNLREKSTYTPIYEVFMLFGHNMSKTYFLACCG